MGDVISDEVNLECHLRDRSVESQRGPAKEAEWIFVRRNLRGRFVPEMGMGVVGVSPLPPGSIGITGLA